MKKIMIIGGGFAGLSAVRRLAAYGLSGQVSLFDRREDFNFLPLLPDCLGRGIAPEFLSNDLADFCARLKIKFIRKEVISLDLAGHKFRTDLAAYDYDYLLLASGAQPNFFSDSQAQTHGYPLNSLADTRRIIHRLKENKFGQIIICGAGYTGVEAATNLWLYCQKNGLSKNITMVERAPSVLGALPGWMQDYVLKNLSGMGIKVLTNTVIEKIASDEVGVSGGRVFRDPLLLWVPGVKSADFIEKSGLPKNPQGRLAVDKYLRVAPDCFCAGDAAFLGDKNNFLRMAVQFAITQGTIAAENIIRSIGNKPLKIYRPRDLGYIIPLANNRACGRVLGLNISGIFAIFLHFNMCIFRSVGWKNKSGIIRNLLRGLFS
jgi:NADH dehydrogenase